jgi:hypothetical protein
MTITLELAPDVLAALAAQARVSGLSLEAFAEEVLRANVRAVSLPTLTGSQIAGQRIRELRQGVTLSGLSVKDLIEEGRE